MQLNPTAAPFRSCVNPVGYPHVVTMEANVMNMTLREVMKVLVVAAVLSPAAAQAQTYPTRPVVMVVPFAAGGTFDVMGRIMAARMSELLGQQVVVENATGAGGIHRGNR